LEQTVRQSAASAGGEDAMSITPEKSRAGMAQAPESVTKLAAEGIECAWGSGDAFAAILTPEALRFVAGLERKFGARRRELLALRDERQQELDAGHFPDFLAETTSIRESDWTIAPTPADLQDRRVEITGPVDRKMVINALNSGAKVFMADLEDAHAPTWEATIQGQLNLRDAVRGTIEFRNSDGAVYKLKPQVATLLVRPRGWHLPEKHMKIDGQPMSGSLCDFSLYFFHNVKARIERGTAPYFYLPKMESHAEARLWNDVFVYAQDELGVPQGTIRATVLIETILAAFEMDEILYELRNHSAGLNCGRWDYIFSFIKKFQKHPAFVLPDRAQVSMTRHFLHSYSLLAIKTCHRRGAHAIGGMAAQIPIKSDPEANAQAIAKVYDDKEREAYDGHDGTWVAHPGLVPVAMDVFNAEMPTPNQLSRQRDDVHVTAADLLKIPRGTITEAGLRTNLRVGVQYLEAWLRGIGCVPLYNLMEDAATAEISRAQVWQWIKHAAKLPDGRVISRELVGKMLDEEMAQFRATLGDQRLASSEFENARKIFEQISTQDEFVDFLTLPAYERFD
jgi:malate synthase